MKLELTTRFKNVEYHDGESRTLLPKLLERLQKKGEELSFILIDGDHSAEGVGADIDSILQYRPTRPLYVLLHDSFNPHCRGGMLSANWEKSEHVHFVDIDFAPGWFYDTPSGMAEERSMWGGFALAVLYPEKREGGLEILQSQKTLYESARLRSRYVGRREKLRACLRILRELF